MQLYFTRHGKTEWNQARRFQGMMGDSPLLPESYKEIQLLGDAIANVPFEKRSRQHGRQKMFFLDSRRRSFHL